MKEFERSKLNRVKRGANRASYDIEKINTILDQNFIGYVCYTYEGTPITIPMAYGRIGDKIHLHGSNGNRMLLGILAAEKTSITVMQLDGLVLARSGFHHSVNYQSVALFGTVKKVEDPTEKIKALKCVMDHMIPNRWETLREMSEKELKQTLVVEFVIQTASAKYRDEGVLDEPEDENLPIWAGIVPIQQKALDPISESDLPPKTAVPQHVIEYVAKHQ